MKVRAKHHFKHKDKNVSAGDVLDVPDHEAKQLQDAGHVEPHGVAPDPQQTQSAAVDPTTPQGGAPPHKDKP